MDWRSSPAASDNKPTPIVDLSKCLELLLSRLPESLFNRPLHDLFFHLKQEKNGIETRAKILQAVSELLLDVDTYSHVAITFRPLLLDLVKRAIAHVRTLHGSNLWLESHENLVFTLAHLIPGAPFLRRQDLF
eukprot:gene5545-171_t